MARKLADVFILISLLAGLGHAAAKKTGSMPLLLAYEGPNDTATIGHILSPLGDINHDGYDDIAVSCSYPHGVFIFLGGNPPSPAPFKFISGIDGFLKPIDLNGDSINDYIAGTSGNLFIYHGYRDSIASVPYDSIIASDNAHSLAVMSLAAHMGPDLGIGVLATCSGYGCQTLRFYQWQHIHDSLPDWSYTMPDYKHDLGDATLIDFNGDGYQDIVMGAPADLDSNGYVYIFLGPNFKSQPDIIIAKPSDIVLDWHGYFAWGITNVCDFDGNGWDDLAVQYVSNGPKFLIYKCGPAAETLPDWRIVDGGDVIAGVGDINGDGYNDIFTGGSGVWEGMVFGYLGGRQPDTNYDVTITTWDIPLASLFDIGWRISPAGDFNGDGYADVMFSCKNLLHDQFGDLVVAGGGKDIISDIEDGRNLQKPAKFELGQNCPNPFNSSTRIEFSIPKQTAVNLDIFNIAGQRIISLIHNQQLLAGSHSVEWNGRDQGGIEVSTGIYLYRLSSGIDTQVRKMLLLK